VVDRFDRLGHDAVVGRDHQDDDVGDLGAARAHGREGLVTRGVEERDGLAVPGDLVGADVLGDATGFTGDHVGLSNLVEQQRLAVVDVAHDGHDRRPRGRGDEVVLVVFVEELREELRFFLLTRVDQLNFGAEFAA
jgi:hypothetical protein